MRCPDTSACLALLFYQTTRCYIPENSIILFSVLLLCFNPVHSVRIFLSHSHFTDTPVTTGRQVRVVTTPVCIREVQVSSLNFGNHLFWHVFRGFLQSLGQLLRQRLELRQDRYRSLPSQSIPR
jgi:hypothetical protein